MRAVRYAVLAITLLSTAAAPARQTAVAPAAGAAAHQTQPPQREGRLMTWTQEQRDRNFPHMERLQPAHLVAHGDHMLPLLAGAPLPVPMTDIDAFMASQQIAGLIVVQDGAVRLERYARGLTADGRWTSFSVAKSFTSTLVGAAIRDGYINSVDEPVTRYIPELAGSGYDGVTIAQLLTMTSGVRWNENYSDTNSDVVRMYATRPPAGMDPTVAFMRTLPREDPPGTRWLYKTGESNLIGVLVKRATGKPLATYLSEKVWKPFGMQADALWGTDPSGQEIGGCCLAMTLRDYARMGLFALGGGHGVVPDGWFAEATAAKAQTGRPGFGYGYQWWTFPTGRFGARGLFGQWITVDPARHMVIAMVSAAEQGADRDYGERRMGFQQRLFLAGDQSTRTK